MHLHVGSIYCIKVDFEHRPTKYAICVSTMPNYGLLINTKDLLRYDPHPIEQRSGRQFPEYDSFIQCAPVFDIQPNQIIKKVGQLHRDEIRDLISKLSSSESLTAEIIETLVAALSLRIGKE